MVTLLVGFACLILGVAIGAGLSKSSVEKLEADNKTLKDCFEELLRVYKNLEKTNYTLSSEIDYHKKKDWVEENKKLSEQVVKVSKELDTVKTENEKLKKKQAAYEKTIKDLNQEIQDLEKIKNLVDLEGPLSISSLEAIETLKVFISLQEERVAEQAKQLEKMNRALEKITDTGKKKKSLPIIFSTSIFIVLEEEVEAIIKSLITIEEDGELKLMFENPLYEPACDAYSLYKEFKKHKSIERAFVQLCKVKGMFEQVKFLEDMMAKAHYGEPESSELSLIETIKIKHSDWIEDDILKNFYEILGITYTKNIDEIHNAYKSMAKVWHPDKHNNSAESNQKFAEINLAKSVLTDDSLKNEYDGYYQQLIQNKI